MTKTVDADKTFLCVGGLEPTTPNSVDPIVRRLGAHDVLPGCVRA
ncbi:MAG: hypothetical protein U5L04_03660 [Trueperaceae bacterium]|nr:hypothetical protein [Trueperaceae bacterium]